MVVFTIIFGKFANFPSEGLQYTTFVYTGLVPWALFAATLTLCASSVVANRALVQRVYFPRLCCRSRRSSCPLVDFCFSFVVLVGVMTFYSDAVQWTVVFAPFFLGPPRTRGDRGRVVPRRRQRPLSRRRLHDPLPRAAVDLGLADHLPDRVACPSSTRTIVYLNPAVLGITGFRWAIAGTPPPETGQVALGLASALALFVAGLCYFRRSESRFADTI